MRTMRGVLTHFVPGQQPLIIWWAVLTHLIWGIAMIKQPPISKLGILVGVDRYIDLGIPVRLIGAILLTAGLMAAIGLILDGSHLLSRRTSMLMLAPQYFLLVSAFFTDGQTILASSVHDIHVGHTILIAILGPIVIAAVLHTIAVYERYSRWISYPR